MSSTVRRTLSYAVVVGLLVACPQAESPSRAQVEVEANVVEANVVRAEVAEVAENDLADTRIQVSVTYCIP